MAGPSILPLSYPFVAGILDHALALPWSSPITPMVVPWSSPITLLHCWHCRVACRSCMLTYDCDGIVPRHHQDASLHCRLGHGGEANQVVPCLVQALTAHKIVNVCLGAKHTVMCSADAIFTCGYPKHGRLGKAAIDGNLYTPQRVQFFF